MTRQQLDETLAVHRAVELFDVDPGDDGFSQVRDRAVVAAGLSFTISDPRLPDNPLVFVNPAFERTTGYSRDEVLGRNCRFLQGADTDPTALQRIRDAIAAQVAARHRDDAKLPLLRRLEELQPTGLSGDSHTAKVLAGSPAVLVDVDESVLLGSIEDPELAEVYREVGLRSAMVLPLRARRQVLGVLSLFTDGSGRTFDEDDLSMAADLARRAALTVDNARLYSREHEVAEQLQRSLLPQLPQIEGLDHAARYLPGSTAAQVGGDWYDLFCLPDGTVGLAVGDVMGHDMTAAAAMGQLRSVLQSYAWQGSEPAVVLDRLDQLVQGLDMAQLATCLYGRLVPPQDGVPGRLRLANAGHLPPALRRPDGSVSLVATSASLLVGAALGTSRDEVEEPVEPGSVIVLYTDGLVEHRGRPLDEGLQGLAAALACAPDGDAEAICEHLIRELAYGDLDDDIALLVVRVLE